MGVDYPTDMDYVPREAWGAITARTDLIPLKPQKIQGIVVHHTTGPAIEPERYIAAHDHHHRWRRGWRGGIAYNWLVSADGRVWEGRGWNQGGATKNWNDKTVAVAYLGDSNEQLPDVAVAALRAVVGWVRSIYGAGLWVKAHSEFKATDCPGGPLREFVSRVAEPALRVSTVKETSVTSGADWAALQALFVALRRAVQARPLRRWRNNNRMAVQAVQSALTAKGFTPGPVDGKYGRKTKAAVQAFQRGQWLMRTDGVVTVAVWDAIFPR